MGAMMKEELSENIADVRSVSDSVMTLDAVF